MIACAIAVKIDKLSISIPPTIERANKYIHLARGENWRVVIVESDSKISIDAILDYTGCPQWAISSLVSDILFLAKSFESSLFFWVKRSGNAAAHEAAKYALESFISFCLCSDNLPARMASACKEDAQALLLSV